METETIYLLPEDQLSQVQGGNFALVLSLISAGIYVYDQFDDFKKGFIEGAARH